MENLLKVIKILVNILMTLILIIGSAFIILYLVGIEPFVVQTGSMQPSIAIGSLSFVNKHVDYNDIKVNDIIAFTVPTGSKATHRVVNITEGGLETKGDANETSDGISVTSENYIGKNIFTIPQVGYLVSLIQTTRGKIMLGTIIIVILLAGFLTDDKKKEKNSEEQK